MTGRRPFRIAHISDLHLSNFGETLHATWKTSLAKSYFRTGGGGRLWATVREQDGWRIQRSRIGSRIFRLLDPWNHRHAFAREEDKLVRLAAVRRAAHVERLVRPPTESELRAYLAFEPENTNLALFWVARAVDARAPDAVIVTGDVTDDGVGHELLPRAFPEYARRRHLFAIPGNHDLSSLRVPLLHRPVAIAEKRRRFDAFMTSLGQRVLPEGLSWEVWDDRIAVLGMNTTSIPRRTARFSRGMVGHAQIAALDRLVHTDESVARSSIRILAIHHHLADVDIARLPHYRRGAMNMRLTDAKAVYAAARGSGVRLVLNGHRHVGYDLRLPGGVQVVSSPSSTLGDVVEGTRYFYEIEIDEERVDVHRVPLEWPRKVG